MEKEKDREDRKRTAAEEKAAEREQTAGRAGEPEQAPEEAATAETPGKRRPEGAPENEARDRVAELEKKLGEKEAEFAKQKDLLLRTAAEYDNYRKRTTREKAAAYADATAAAIREVLPVADSLERALEQKECAADDMRKGVELVHRQICSAFEKLGIEEMGSEGEPFDPALHNAVSHVEDKDLGENVVAKVFQKGYKIGGRVIRHAMVQVAN